MHDIISVTMFFWPLVAQTFCVLFFSSLAFYLPPFVMYFRVTCKIEKPIVALKETPVRIFQLSQQDIKTDNSRRVNVKYNNHNNEGNAVGSLMPLTETQSELESIRMDQFGYASLCLSVSFCFSLSLSFFLCLSFSVSLFLSLHPSLPLCIISISKHYLLLYIHYHVFILLQSY